MESAGALRVCDNVSDIPKSNEQQYDFSTITFKKLAAIERKQVTKMYSSDLYHPIFRLSVAFLSWIKAEVPHFCTGSLELNCVLLLNIEKKIVSQRKDSKIFIQIYEIITNINGTC